MYVFKLVVWSRPRSPTVRFVFLSFTFPENTVPFPNLEYNFNAGVCLFNDNSCSMWPLNKVWGSEMPLKYALAIVCPYAIKSTIRLQRIQYYESAGQTTHLRQLTTRYDSPAILKNTTLRIKRWILKFNSETILYTVIIEIW